MKTEQALQGSGDGCKRLGCSIKAASVGKWMDGVCEDERWLEVARDDGAGRCVCTRTRTRAVLGKCGDGCGAEVSTDH